MKYKHLAYTLLLALTSMLTQAQVKIGKNPTTITAGALLDIEGSTTTTRTVSLTNGNFGIGTNAPSSLLDVNGNVGIRDNYILEFGHELVSKEPSAGRVGYNLGVANTLGIIGGGTTSGERKVVLYDKVGVGIDPDVFALKVSGNQGIVGGGFLEFGSGLTKDINAGRIGYGTFGGTTLGIIGGGTTSGERKVVLYDKVGVGIDPDVFALKVSGNQGIVGGGFLEFGSGLTKDINAGKIGYGTFGGTTLGIIGGGTTSGERKVVLYDKVGVGIDPDVFALKVSGNQGIVGGGFLEFGSGLTKDINAGKIGYNTFDGTTLGIIGSGTTSGERKIALYDKVGIGVAPVTTLHVNGQVRIADGSQGDGKVYISDASGTGTWRTLNQQSIPEVVFVGRKIDPFNTMNNNVGGPLASRIPYTTLGGSQANGYDPNTRTFYLQQNGYYRITSGAELQGDISAGTTGYDVSFYQSTGVLTQYFNLTTGTRPLLTTIWEGYYNAGAPIFSFVATSNSVQTVYVGNSYLTVTKLF